MSLILRSGNASNNSALSGHAMPVAVFALGDPVVNICKRHALLLYYFICLFTDMQFQFQ